MVFGPICPLVLPMLSPLSYFHSDKVRLKQTFQIPLAMLWFSWMHFYVCEILQLVPLERKTGTLWPKLLPMYQYPLFKSSVFIRDHFDCSSDHSLKIFHMLLLSHTNISGMQDLWFLLDESNKPAAYILRGKLDMFTYLTKTVKEEEVLVYQITIYSGSKAQ